MTPITHFNHTSSENVLDAAEKALAGVAEQYGLSVEISRPTFNDVVLSMKVSLGVTRDEHGEASSPGQIEFNRYADALAVPRDWYGKRFQSGGSTFEVTGLRPSRPKNCIAIVNVRTGKEFVCPPSMVRSGLALADLATKAPTRQKLAS